MCLEELQVKFKRKIWTWTRIWTSDLQISSLTLYHLSYPCSIDSTGLNLPLESNAMQALWSVTLSVIIWPTKKLHITYSFFWYFKIKLTSKYKPIVCVLKNYNLNSREKIETQTFRSIAWHYHLSYPGSIDGTGLNLPLESNAMQALRSVTLSVINWPTN